MRNAAGNELETSAADAYRALWESGAVQPRVEEFLLRWDALPADELLEVLLIDQSQRWQQGQGRAAEDYLAAFPAVAAEPRLRIDMVYGEYRARQLAGDHCEPAEFLRRFADLREELTRQFELSSWLLRDDTVILSAQGDPNYETIIVPKIGTPPDDDFAPLSFDDFELLRLLGKGAMGEVHLARQRSLDKPVAIKLLNGAQAANRDRLARFLREAKAAAALRHPGIVDVHGIGRRGHDYFLVMDYIEGQSLDQRLAHGPLPVREAVEIAAEVAEALDHAHRRGIIHRDVKPGNVMIASDGRVLVTDFGLAKVGPGDGPELSRADEVIGTPLFMAPEQMAPSRGPVTPATDVYGLGAMFYALLVGKPPIEGSSTVDVAVRLLSPVPPTAPRQRRPEIPARVEAICLRCLKKLPSDRYTTAGELAKDLRAWLAALPVDEGPKLRWRNAVTNRRAMLQMAACVAIVLGATVAWRKFGADHGSPTMQPLEVAWTVDVFRGGRQDQRQRITEQPGAIHSDDQLRVAAAFSRPMFAYAFWIDAAGQVSRLEQSADESKVTSMEVPADSRLALPVTGSTGTELCVLLLRDTRLAEPAKLVERLTPPAGLPELADGTLLVDGRLLADGDNDASEPADSVVPDEALAHAQAKLRGDSRAVGPARPLTNNPAAAALEQWLRTLPKELGTVRYVAVRHAEP